MSASASSTLSRTAVKNINKFLKTYPDYQSISGSSNVTPEFVELKISEDIIQFRFSWNLSGDSALCKYAEISRDLERFVYVMITVIPPKKEIVLSTWWSLLGMNSFALSLATPIEKEQYKGLAYKTFCFMLDKIFSKYREYSLIEKISLTAIPSMGSARTSTKPVELINYYRRLGFEPVKDFDITLESVDMVGTVGSVIKNCVMMGQNKNNMFEGIEMKTMK